MPPTFVKKNGQLIHYYYAKLVIAPSAGLAGNHGFITNRFKALEAGQIQISNYDRELWLKETEPQSTCAYCGGPGPLVADHVIPLAISGPDAMHNILRVCRDCNSTKSDRDLIEWWNAVLAPRLGPASDSLPRLAAGIYLKLAYDWHRIHNTLEMPAHELTNLLPFRTSETSRGPKTNDRPAGPRPRSRVAHPVERQTETPTHENIVAKRATGETSGIPRALDLILGSYLYKDELRQLLADLELATSGSKDELIHRLVKESHLDPRQALKFLDRQELGILCEELGLPSRGLLRGSLEDRIFAAILTERRTSGN
jgi:hypothetical protein